MKTLGSKILKFYSSLIILVLLASHQLRAHEVDVESEFSYDEEDNLGPGNWGKIKPEWSLCSNGTMQSPIDLMNERVDVVSNLGQLHRDYKPSNTTLTNRGHDMMLSWVGDAGHIHINGTLYPLRQTHWHSPSEHSINGKRYDLEVHMVHQTPEEKIAVIGIIYKIGRPDPFLPMIENDMKALAHTTDLEKAVGILDPKQIKLGSRKYYRYIGSLTTPPCHQNVIWTIGKKVRTVSRHQLKMIREAAHERTNARPIQPLNQRRVKMYRPNVEEDD
ncbi:OLC1v1003872C1 [Oldenlandia corymbosa var. corymbosa]|uniref:Carbonic anhydrase n=1 Tax=Oldenlandia corymbosa var. corymbosa TaxID=529605 RepID=A0AAV1DAY6_OLDCO|nr:OLC1v1003872C1 [Oldenlandia corymbosa var. corymbosa]